MWDGELMEERLREMERDVLEINAEGAAPLMDQDATVELH
jgi:hypothetical protein